MPKLGMKKIRRTQVIEATIRCIETKGIESLTMQVVANEAKVSTGTIYYYFGNKERLLLSVLKYAFAKSNIDVMEVVEPLKSRRKKLLKHIERMMIVPKDNPQFSTIQLAYYGQALNNPGVKNILNKFFKNIGTYISTYLEGGSQEKISIKNKENFITVLLAAAAGTGVLWSLNPGSFDMDETIRIFQDMVDSYIESSAKELVAP